MLRLKQHHKAAIKKSWGYTKYISKHTFRLILKLISWVICFTLVGWVGYLIYQYGEPEKWSGYLNTKFISTFMNLAWFNISLIFFDFALGRHTISRLIEINKTGVTKEEQYEQKKIALIFYGLYMSGTCYLLGLAI